MAFAQADPFDLALPIYYQRHRDTDQYRALVQLGAESGDPLALYAMATWYLHGSKEIGIRRNKEQGIKLLTRASQTLNRAMYDLAVCKVRGYGVQKDLRGAYQLFARAARLGSIAAMREQAQSLRNGSGVRRNEAAAERIEQRLSSIEDRIARLSTSNLSVKGVKRNNDSSTQKQLSGTKPGRGARGGRARRGGRRGATRVGRREGRRRGRRG
ncbi:MAG: sel1 repeat family protein [Deltaproteobacteria bacterium]|nr:sel1 repeat family protein [Deltaproteobacteria bacterium]